MNAKRNNRWAIVGGGVLGMTLAHRLAEQGKSVTIFEKEDHLGGLADSWQIGIITWDRYYHVILLSDLELRGVLSELELEDDIHWVETKTGFYTDGALYSMSNVMEFFRFPPLSLIDKIRLAATIFYGSKIKNWKSLEKTLASDWLCSLSGRHTFEKIWLPLLRSKLGENYKLASASFIWAIIARMYAARKSGMKKEMFGYVPGGYNKIINKFKRMLEQEKVLCRLNYAVEKIKQSERGVEIEFCSAIEKKEEFDSVIMTVPNPTITKLCPTLSEEEKERLKSTIYQGIVCVSLILKNSLSEYYITNITESWVPFTTVIEMSTIVSKKYLGGNCLIYLPKYLTTDDPTFNLSDNEVVEVFLSGLEKMYPHFRRDQIISSKVTRTRYLLPVTTRYYSESMPDHFSSIPNLYIINSSQIPHGTFNVNETVRLANLSAKTIMEVQS